MDTFLLILPIVVYLYVMKLILVIILLLTSAVTTIVYHETQSTDINYYKAHRYFEKGDYGKAIPLYKKTLAAKQSYTVALKELGYAYQWTDRHAEAISTFLKFLSYKPQDSAVKKSLAETYLWMKDYDKAIGISREVLGEKPGDAEAKLILAEAIHYSGNPKEAVVIYKAILTDKTARLSRVKEKRIRKLLGEAYMMAKDYNDSIGQYRMILRKTPKDIKARLAIADMLSWEQKYDEAVKEYLEALKIEPGNAEAMERLVKVYVWKKDYASAEKLFKEIIARSPESPDTRVLLGQMLTWQGRYAEAVKYLEAALSKDADNLKTMESLADVLSYTKEFQRAILLYRNILAREQNREVKRKLADVLSWDRQYSRSVKIYDELLTDKDDAAIRLQKARVMGWAKNYKGALKEYRRVLDAGYDYLADLEMRSKAAYWNNRVKKAINLYSDLIIKDRQNTEAIFDLSQIYAHNQIWAKAKKEFKKILAVSEDHFRAKEGLEKAELISEHLSWSPGYEFMESDSQSRDMDIRKHIISNKFKYPVMDYLSIGADYNITTRSFSDFNDLLENEARVKLSYVNNPYGWAEGFYDIIAYNRDISAISTFGGRINIRIFDIGTIALSYERERLENTSNIIRNHYYTDNFKERVDIDVNSRLKVGADYLYESYSDHNDRYEPGFDVLYYFSLDPLRFSVKYRYFYKQFRNKVPAYWSPKGFTTNSAEFNWRHYLNKEEIFSGADDIYYELGYNVSLDSTNIVGHKFSGALNWDVNKRLNLNVKGSFTNSSCNVYRDSDVVVSLKYYF